MPVNFAKTILLKNLLYAILIIGYTACTSSGSKENIVKDPLPNHSTASKKLSPAEFAYYHDQVKRHFDLTLLNKYFNGQILVAKNGVVVFEEYIGYADIKKKDTMTAETPLHIASAGKTFCAMAILHLAEEGKLNLDDSLTHFFPGLPYHGITIKMLLSHRSGLPNYLYYLSSLKKKDTCYTNQDVLNSLYDLQPKIAFRPNTRFGYSNTNFVLLAMIIEKITGQSYPSYLKKIFFDPLQMNHTHVHVVNDSITATSSFQWNGSYWKPDPFDCTYGDKNIYTTVRDMLKWDQALYGNLLFKKQTLDSAFTPRSNERRSVHNYGWGWRMLNLPNGKKIIYHNGRWHGTNAVFARLTDANATIIIIGNKYDRRIYSSATTSYDIFGEYFKHMAAPPIFEEDSTENEPADSLHSGSPDMKSKK